MARIRLLKRILHWNETGLSDYEIGADDYIQSIMQDLTAIFNTSKGSVMVDSDYGMVDYSNTVNNVSATEMERLAKDIKQVAMCFDKRIHSATITPIERSGDLSAMAFNARFDVAYRSQTLSFGCVISLFANARVELVAA